MKTQNEVATSCICLGNKMCISARFIPMHDWPISALCSYTIPELGDLAESAGLASRGVIRESFKLIVVLGRKG
jgi:hypothetical protein